MFERQRQLVASFNCSHLATLLAVSRFDALESANIDPFGLLVGFIVVAIFNLFLTGAVAMLASVVSMLALWTLLFAV
jgi:p-aminobenzoyl-glutamate transporter AbgT